MVAMKHIVWFRHIQYWMRIYNKPFESYCSLHCTFVFCIKLQQQVNSMFSLMCAMICWEKMKTPIRKSRLM